jgi:hypothetical protein
LQYLPVKWNSKSGINIDEEMDEVESIVIFVALREVVQKIRTASPNTKILLSYITTAGAIYGPNFDQCMKITREIFPHSVPYVKACREGPGRQSKLSKVLLDMSLALGIDYVDPTPELREVGQSKILHPTDDGHFNDEAARIYAEVLKKKIVGLLSY